VEDKGNKFYSQIMLEGDSPTGFFLLTVIGEPDTRLDASGKLTRSAGTSTTDSHSITHRSAA
jgi:hypothetical protein